MSPPFTAERRRALLDECFARMDELLDLELEPPDQRASAQAPARARLDALREEYREGVPMVQLARCPSCGAPTLHSIDPLGLDGLWWSHDDPVRPHTDELAPPCPHYLGLSGAVTLGGTVEVAPFLVKPGPEVPFVVPRLLREASVRVVIASLGVGPHRAYPIVYFADPAPAGDADLERLATWGTATYRFTRPDGGFAWGEPRDDERDADFDLAPWLDAGKLQWIAPGDEALTLRRGAEGCPYRDLPGRRAALRIQDGRVWTAP